MHRTPKKINRKGTRKASSDRTVESIREVLIKTADRYDNDHFEVGISEALSSEIGSVKIGQFPQGLSLMICQDAGTFHIGYDYKNQVSHCKSLPFEGWNHKYSVVTYGGAMAKAIDEISKSNRNVEFEQTEDNLGDHFNVWYKVRFSEDVTIREVIAYFENFDRELEGHTERILERGGIDRGILKDERRFALNVLLPLFRSMDCNNVQFNHGPREFGKDILFSDTDKFGFRRVYGVQVKAGDVSGEAGAELDKLISQIDDALRMSYLDIYSKERTYITDLIIAISGRFTGNAPEKICEKAKRENIRFLDIDKIQQLLLKYRGKKIE